MKSIQEFEISPDSAIDVWFVWVEFEHNWVGPCQFDWILTLINLNLSMNM